MSTVATAGIEVHGDVARTVAASETPATKSASTQRNSPG